jgi:polysaccharide export outer membrane protein
MPEYVIEIPDILLIEAVNNIRPAHAVVHAGEPLLIQVNRTIPIGQQENPVAQQFKQLNGVFVIGTDGYLNLGPEYGKVLVAEEPLAEIQRRVETHLQQILTSPQVLVTLPRPENKQYVAGQHLVRPDGTVGLGIYGSVYVTGMTLQQAKQAIEQHLSQHIHRPEVSVDVLAYNSKVYYVITDGGGAGEQVYKMPITGNETVLDAVANIQGLPTVASKGAIWIARPTAEECGPDQILKVDWNAIAQGAQTATNYQVLPGDRLYVKASPMITFDTKLAKFTAPFERMLGFTILGNGTVRAIQRGPNAQGGF